MSKRCVSGLENAESRDEGTWNEERRQDSFASLAAAIVAPHSDLLGGECAGIDGMSRCGAFHAREIGLCDGGGRHAG